MGRTFLDLNWASTVINTLLVAFFVLAAGAIFIGAYSARTLGKREKAAAAAHGDVAKEKPKGVKKAEKKAEKAAKKAEATPRAPKATKASTPRPTTPRPTAPKAPKDDKDA